MSTAGSIRSRAGWSQEGKKRLPPSTNCPVSAPTSAAYRSANAPATTQHFFPSTTTTTTKITSLSAWETMIFSWSHCQQLIEDIRGCCRRDATVAKDMMSSSAVQDEWVRPDIDKDVRVWLLSANLGLFISLIYLSGEGEFGDCYKMNQIACRQIHLNTNWMTKSN